MANFPPNYLNVLSEQASRTSNQIYLVGGTVRDHLLGAEWADVDFTVKNVKEFACQFAEKTQSPCVPLDKTPGRETFRVVLGKEFNFDFTEMQGKSIEDDLSQRDFTINAMAVPLQDFIAGTTNIIDPHGGRSDLQHKIIRVVPGPIFTSDPLRMLRAFRFAALLKFEIEPETINKITETSGRIRQTAPERIYYELILFLNAPNTYNLLQLMDQTGLLELVLPPVNNLRQTPVAQANAWETCLQTYKILEESLLSPEILSLTKKGHAPVKGKNSALLKLACLLHQLDYLGPIKSGPPTQIVYEESKTVTQLKNLRASNADIHFVFQTIQVQKEAVGSNLDFAKDPINESQLYHFVKKYDGELIPGLILACAVVDSMPGNQDREKKKFMEAANRVTDFYFHRYLPAMKQKALLSGKDLIRQFKLSPSPLFRVILDRVEEGRVLGSIKTRLEAEQVARNIIETQ